MYRISLSLHGFLIGSCVSLALPVQAQTPPSPAAKALLEVHLPDPYGVLYVDDRKTESRGEVILLETPVLDASKANVYHLRAAFRSGDQMLIQDRTVAVQPGRTTTVHFDGKGALSIPLPVANANPASHELLPYPRRVDR